MSSVVGRARQLAGALVVSLAMLGGLTPASAADKHTSPQDRARFVSITHGLEQAPLKPGAGDDRTWAMKWLIDAPDVSVSVCLDSLGALADSDYAYAPEIVIQYTVAMGAFVIEHPQEAGDDETKQLAGVESALAAYRSILRDKPESKSAVLDGLLATQAQGGLPAFIHEASVRCSKA